MLQINPGFVAALVGLAQLRTQAGDRTAALTHLQRARELAPENIAVALEFAGMQANSGRRDDAVATINSALRKSPDNLNCLMKLGMIERARGNAAAAATHFRAASSAHPNHLLAYVRMAAEFRLGNPATAQELLRSVLASEPDHVEARAQVATQAQAAGDHETAYAQFLRAYELRPSSCWYGLAAASLSATVRSVAEAERLFARIEMEEIARPAAKMQRGNLYPEFGATARGRGAAAGCVQ